MTRSRIFEEYARIAEERGLIKKADYYDDRGNDRPKVDMSTEKRTTRQTYKPEVMSTTEIFYGVKPNGEEMHIMERAHPEPVIIADSYDKINALVENNLERHNIMVNLVNRPNDGAINHRKLAAHAQQELVFELVRIANDLDIRGEDGLRVLADDCIQKMSIVDAELKSEADFWDNVKSFFSEKGEDAGDVAVGAGTGAVAGAVIGGIIGAVVTAPVGEAGGLGPLAGATAGAWIGGASAGLIAAVAGTSPKAKSVAINSASTIKRIDILLQKEKNPFLLKMRGDIVKLFELATAYATISSTPTGNAASEEQSHKITSDYIHQMATIKTDVEEYKAHADMGDFEDKGEGDMWSKIKTPLYNLINNKVTDVTKELGSLMRTIDVAQQSMASIKEHGKNEAENQQKADVLTQKLNSPTPSAPAAPAKTHAAPPSGVAAPQAKEEESLFGL